MNLAYLWSRSKTLYKQKAKILFVTRSPNFWKFDFCFWFLQKEKNGVKTNLLRLLSSKNLSQIPSKIFATQCFFTDHLKYKTVNKTTFRTPSANPRQICPRQLKSFPAAMIIFWGFHDFLIYLVNYFWSLLNSPYLIFQLRFFKSSVNKTV